MSGDIKCLHPKHTNSLDNWLCPQPRLASVAKRKPSATYYLWACPYCCKYFSKAYVVRGQGSGLTGDRDYYDNSANDQTFINFDLKADLSPLFNWNVKALYLYLTAEYITKDNVLNEMVLWDKIVMNGEKMELDMKAAKVIN